MGSYAFEGRWMNISSPEEIVIFIVNLNPVFSFRSFPTAKLAEILKLSYNFPNSRHLHLSITNL
jgi:hypothetical protein